MTKQLPTFYMLFMNYRRPEQLFHLDVTLHTQISSILQRLAIHHVDNVYLWQHPKSPVYMSPDSSLIDHLDSIPNGGYVNTPVVYFTDNKPQTPVTPAPASTLASTLTSSLGTTMNSIPNSHLTSLSHTKIQIPPTQNTYTAASSSISTMIFEQHHSNINQAGPDWKNIKPIIYTDGSHNDNIGGWAYVMTDGERIIIHPELGELYASGHLAPSTNNYAELMAIYKALFFMKFLGYTDGLIYSDSQYCIKSLTIWYQSWLRNNWKKADGQPVKNKEIIEAILDLQSSLKINYQHVKAHNGDKFNEIADQLANQARLNKS